MKHALMLAAALATFALPAYAQDTALLDQAGHIIQVWRNTHAGDVSNPPAGTLMEFAPGQTVTAGQTYSGGVLTSPAPSVIVIDKTQFPIKRAEILAAFTSCQSAGTALQVLNCVVTQLTALQNQ